MEIRALSIAGAWEVTPRQFRDERGVFLEAFRGDVLAEAVGHRLDVVRTNVSVSSAGTVRGIHFADVPPSQAKYVTCLSGVLVDFVVDVRVGSPTFGHWDPVRLDAMDRGLRRGYPRVRGTGERHDHAPPMLPGLRPGR